MHILLSHTDQELLSLMAAGKESAFTTIYHRYWDKLFAIAAQKLGNLAEAEEVVQEIFLDIWNRRAELEVTGSLSAYLAVAVKYRVINMLAKRNRQHRYAHHAAQAFSVVDTSTEQWLSFEELRSRLMAIVKELPDKCRLVFELSREAGLSHREIAHEMGIAEKTVEAHLSRALRTLRTELGISPVVLLALLGSNL